MNTEILGDLHAILPIEWVLPFAPDCPGSNLRIVVPHSSYRASPCRRANYNGTESSTRRWHHQIHFRGQSDSGHG